ncbi:MAG TPA: enoyl-CoA hydratase/isomerase family protein [Acidimicrobiia bacterium]|nr:enoyl-CoA hydratase/isomerase family protein [Acidimicrobiia bacterium]
MSTVAVEPAGDAIRVIRLDRPDRLNAISFELVADLHDALDEVAADETCKVAVLTGTGRGFCAGLDLRDFGTPPSAGEHPHYPAGTTGQSFMANLTQHIRATPQIVLAAVNGPAFGGGLSLALACDLRVAARSATFCSAFIKTGLTGTDIGVTYLLPRLIGASRAFDLIVTGRTVDAGTAEHLGIVSQVFDDDGFLDTALAMAGGIAAYTGIGLRMTKEVMWANLDTPNMAACIALENRNQEIAGKSSEVQEYMRAYSGRVTG